MRRSTPPPRTQRTQHALLALALLGGCGERIATGSAHTVAVNPAGDAYAWGSNWNGQLGDGTVEHRSTPTAAAIGLSFP